MDKNKIKVLAILKDGSGSHYHRLKYGLGKINGLNLEDKEIQITFEKDTEGILKEAENHDIFVYHWDTNKSIHDISLLQAKGIRVLYSIDDFWEFSILHPYYQNEELRQYTKNKIRKHLLNADAVMVTTERLMLQCKNYNDNIAIIPNFLDPKDFNIKEKTKSDKLRVSLIGSLSHYPDYLMMKQVLNRLAKNKTITDNVQFQLCGVDKNSPHWMEIVDIFKKKKNIDLVTKDFLDLDNYLDFYADTDVALMPLEYTEFNICKSALKLAECAITNTLPVGSSLYSTKELKGIVVAENPKDYEDTILKLLDRNYYDTVLKYVTDNNLKDNDYTKRFENTKAVIGAVYNEDLKPKLENIEIYGITYDEKQNSEYTTYNNSEIRTLEQKSWRFEYNPIIDIVGNLSQDTEYLGIFSWKFPLKTGFTKNILYKTLSYYKYKDYDFINLSRNYWQDTDTYLNFGYKYHPKLEVLLKRLLKHLNIEYKYNKDTNCYSNFFIMKSDLWKDYVDNWVKPALEFMENDQEYYEDANYFTGLKPEKLKELTGLDHYTYHTFVLERLILFFVHNKRLTVKNVI